MRLKRALSSEDELHLTFSSGDTQQTVELSSEAAKQLLRALQVVERKPVDEVPFTLTVLGHQVMRTPEAYGLLLRTQEFGEVVFSFPQLILRALITDLMHLESAPPELRTSAETTESSGSKVGESHH